MNPRKPAVPPPALLPKPLRPAVQGQLRPAAGIQRKSAPGVAAFPVNLRPKPGGQQLPAAVRQKMEQALGADFHDVRVHVGQEAPRIGAVAFTWGSQIHFAPGQYQPHTAQGQKLLAHELTHVIQQRQGRVRNPFGSGVAVVQDRRLEAEADRAAQRLLQPTPARARAGKLPARAVQQKPASAIQRNGVVHIKGLSGVTASDLGNLFGSIGEAWTRMAGNFEHGKFEDSQKMWVGGAAVVAVGGVSTFGYAIWDYMKGDASKSEMIRRVLQGVATVASGVAGIIAASTSSNIAAGFSSSFWVAGEISNLMNRYAEFQALTNSADDQARAPYLVMSISASVLKVATLLVGGMALATVTIPWYGIIPGVSAGLGALVGIYNHWLKKKSYWDTAVEWATWAGRGIAASVPTFGFGMAVPQPVRGDEMV
jgi:hypothetical protein